MFTTIHVVATLFIAYTLHLTASACEIVSAGDGSSSRAAWHVVGRWLSLAALATITTVYGLELLTES
jgi:hypothetical protein